MRRRARRLILCHRFGRGLLPRLQAEHMPPRKVCVDADDRDQSLGAPGLQDLSCITTNGIKRITAAQRGANQDLGYDPMDRLATASQTGGMTQGFTWDSGDNRTSKCVDGATATSTLGGVPQTTPYVWLGGELQGVQKGGSYFWAYSDHLGRPEVLANASGTPVWRARNHAIGRDVVLNDAAVGGLNIGFPGLVTFVKIGLTRENPRPLRRMDRYCATIVLRLSCAPLAVSCKRCSIVAAMRGGIQ